MRIGKVVYKYMAQILEQTVDKILIVVLEMQEQQKDISDRLHKMENSMDLLYNRIDQFLHMVDRHEAEIAALRSAYQRLDERLRILETARA